MKHLRSLMIAAAVWTCALTPSWALPVFPPGGVLGPNPNIAYIGFDGLGAFVDDFTFSLTAVSNFQVKSTANDAGPTISGWQLTLIETFPVAGFPIGGPINAVPVTGGQQVGFTTILSPGDYILRYTGIGLTAFATYSGTITTTAVGIPGPIAGAGIPGLLFAGASAFAWWRRRQSKTQVPAAVAA